MIDESFRIYVEQLRDGQIEALTECFPADFLDVKEEALSFFDPVNIDGEAYLADDMLILHLNVSTIATMPCRICNEPVKVNVEINEFYHAEPLDEIKGSIFNFREILREAILLETPPTAECHEGKCPKRKTLQKFLKKEGEKENKDDDEGYRPFADLELK